MEHQQQLQKQCTMNRWEQQHKQIEDGKLLDRILFQIEHHLIFIIKYTHTQNQKLNLPNFAFFSLEIRFHDELDVWNNNEWNTMEKWLKFKIFEYAIFLSFEIEFKSNKKRENISPSIDKTYIYSILNCEKKIKKFSMANSAISIAF